MNINHIILSGREILTEESGYSLLKDNAYRMMWFSSASSVLINIWKSGTIAMNTYEFMNETHALVQSLFTHKPNYMITDHREFYMRIQDEHKAFTSYQLSPVIHKSGLKRVGIILNDNLSFMADVEELIEAGDNTASVTPLQIQKFSTLHDALRWK
ncbi:MAG: hypothetical protein IAE67_03270 [Candidatus Competibacteraceae bacterium]|nr:hypothetical protein [Candidatus Competibacteraceae bacterium]